MLLRTAASQAGKTVSSFLIFPVMDPQAEKARVAATDAMFNSISDWVVATFSKVAS